MEIRHLRLIKEIVAQGSIAKAIDKLHLTQSALSHQLKEFEYQLGTKVFLRDNRRLTLTRAGEKVYETAIEVLAKIEDTEKEIRTMTNGETGEIRISTECFSSYHWLPAVMKKFQGLYPNVELKIVMEATHYPLQKLLSNALDLAVISDTLKDEKIRYIDLFQDEVVMLVAENHHWANKKFVVAADFLPEHLLIHSFPLETVTVFQSLLTPADITPKKITALPLTEASIEMVKAGMGIMSMAKWAAQPYLKDTALKAIKIGRNGLKRRHYIAVLNNKTYPAYFTHFIEFLQTEINLQWNI
jgi:LysR family transcriptional regulator for metE and metH